MKASAASTAADETKSCRRRESSAADVSESENESFFFFSFSFFSETLRVSVCESLKD